MEPLRGFPEFMQSLPSLLDIIPNLQVLIGGRDRSAYGPIAPTQDGSWKNMVLEKMPMLKNHPRITYTGLMNYENYLLMLQRTNLHCYLTKPYVTSWSLFEAAACGTPVITNESPATSGSVKIPEHRLLKNIHDISKDSGISMIRDLINKENPNRVPFLGEEFNMKNSKLLWSQVINRALLATE